MRGAVDIGLTVPSLMVLIVVALTLREGMRRHMMALVIASLAWLYPARTIRSQVLTLRERAVQIARMSGTTGPGIIVKELLPNLLPHHGLVRRLDLGRDPRLDWPRRPRGSASSRRRRLGMTLCWVNFTGAVINGWWWWWLAPIVVVAVLFIALFLISIGLDEVANPRLRPPGLIASALDRRRIAAADATQHRVQVVATAPRRRGGGGRPPRRGPT